MSEQEINAIIDYIIDKNKYWVPQHFNVDGTPGWGGYWSTRHDWKGEYISIAYRKARDRFEIPIDYDEFARLISNKTGGKTYWGWSKWEKKKKGMFGHYPWAKKTAYRRKPEHEKKELSETLCLCGQ